MQKVSWGVLGAANIAVQKVIPAMQKGEYSEIKAIASRDINKAKDAADKLNIPETYGSYEELLQDKSIDAVYIPLPNHLHVEWSIKALEAGKHVLCEKPIGLNAAEAEHLKKESGKYPELKLMEAFMYKLHPQMIKTKQLIKDGAIGELKNIHSVFTYYNVDPDNVRNRKDIGGGLLDIGCYNISLSRFLFDGEPVKVVSAIDFDPEMKIDRLVSAVMEFKNGTATFTCSTQLNSHQYAEVIGTKGKIIIDIPFTPPPDAKTKIIFIDNNGSSEISFEPEDKYTIQGDLFSLAVLNNTPVPTNFDDAVSNMKVIDKIFEGNINSGRVK